MPAAICGKRLMPSSYSPACILSFFLTALVRGEFNDAWTWSDEVEDKSADQSSKPNSNGEEKAVDVPAVIEKSSVSAVTDAPKDEAEAVSQSEEAAETPDKKKRSKKKRD